MSLTDKFNTFHTFSKTPVTDSADFSLAVNASGHTVQDGDVLASKLPFYSREQFNSIDEAHEKLGSSTVENDLVSVVENGVEVVYKRNAAGYSENVQENWSKLSVEGGLPDGYELRNSEGTVVAVFHKSQPLEAVTYDNNSKAGSESAGGGHLAGRLKVDGKYIPFFLDVTNCERNGYPALGYKPLVECATQEIYPSGNGKEFWVSSSSGMVVFEEVNGKGRDFESGTGRLGPITISCFEYKGLKLDEKVDEAVEAVETSLSQLNTKINEETSRAMAAEEALGGRLTGAEADIDALQETVEGHTADIASLQGTVSQHTADIGGLGGRLTAAEATVAQHGSAIATLQGWAPSIFGSGPGAIEGRLKTAEGTIKVFGNNFNTVFGWGPSIFGNGPESLEGRITAAEGDIDSLQGTVGQHTTDISGLKTRLTTAEGNISTLRTDLDDETTRAQGVENALEESIEGVSERVGAIEGDYLKAADKTELEGKITAEKERAEGAESVLTTAVATEKSRAEAKELELSGKITTIEGNLGVPGADAGTGSAFARIKKIENDYLQAADKTELANKITAEETRA